MSVGFVNGVLQNVQGIIPLGDRSQDIGTSSKAFNNLYIDGISFDDGNTYLDDYEEGTFTPELSFTTSSSGVTYFGRFGVYQKMGNRVNIITGAVVSSTGTGSGDGIVTGLPFTSATVAFDQAFPIVSETITFTALYSWSGWQIQSASTQLIFREYGSGVTGNNIPFASFGINNSRFFGQFQYIT